MTTLTNVFQVWALSDGAAIRDASGLVHQVHHRDMDWLDFVAYPIETLHPRMVTMAEVNKAAQSNYERATPGELRGWHQLSEGMRKPFILDVTRTLDSLGIGVTE